MFFSYLRDNHLPIVLTLLTLCSFSLQIPITQCKQMSFDIIAYTSVVIVLLFYKSFIKNSILTTTFKVKIIKFFLHKPDVSLTIHAIITY